MNAPETLGPSALLEILEAFLCFELRQECLSVFSSLSSSLQCFFLNSYQFCDPFLGNSCQLIELLSCESGFFRRPLNLDKLPTARHHYIHIHLSLRVFFIV